MTDNNSDESITILDLFTLIALDGLTPYEALEIADRVFEIKNKE
jgi:hypothetical protein